MMKHSFTYGALAFGWALAGCGTSGESEPSDPAAISVSPESFDFGRVAPSPARSDGPLPSARFEVANTGGETLHFASLTLSGSPAFTPLVDGRDPRRPLNADAIHDPDGDGLPGLAPGEAFVIEVQYAPTAQMPEAARLALESDDPVRPTAYVELTAQGR